MPLKSISVYIHWPFCKSKCPYCDFNSYALTSKIDEEEWTSAYLKSINHFKHLLEGKQLRSIHFGGGTPSLMPLKTIEAIIDTITSITKSPAPRNCSNMRFFEDSLSRGALRRGDLGSVTNSVKVLRSSRPNGLRMTTQKSHFSTVPEIAIEVNPTSTEQTKLQSFKELGINRLSIGVQALNDHDLKTLGRTHSAHDALKAIDLAQNIFDNYSFDLIYARPNQSIKAWQEELTQAIKLAKHHLSCYQLTIEPNTPFHTAHKNKTLKLPSQSTQAQMYELTREFLEANNIHQYEVSNYAMKGKESVHNLAYWNYDEYLGIGPGAHSRVKLDGKDMYALTMESCPTRWLSTQHYSKEQLTNQQIATEYVLMNLRKINGLDVQDFHRKFNHSLYDYLNPDNLKKFQIDNWLTCTKNNISLTNTGRLFLDYIVQKILI